MVISSFNALNKIEGGSMRELNHYITQIVEGAIVAEAVKPTGLHFLVFVRDLVYLVATKIHNFWHGAVLQGL
jgi:hypothetical protein